MDEYRVRITSANFIENIACMPLSEALTRGQVRDSIFLSESGHMALKAAGVEDYSDVNVPVGMQPLEVEFINYYNEQDAFTDALYRPVVDRCPEQECGKCILAVMPDDEQLGGTTVLQDLQWSSHIDFDKYR